MREATKQFEEDIRQVVRRGSRSNEFESSINEICSHYADLIQEELCKGSTQEVAEQNATARIGTPKSIGRQILNSPSRMSKGLGLQKLGLIGLWISAVQFIVMEYCVLRGWQGLILSTFGYSFFVLLIVSAFAFGFGAGLIKKVLWMPLVASFPGSILLFGIARFALNPVYESYYHQFESNRLNLPITFLNALDYGFQYNERLIGTFAALAATSFLMRRIWLIQKSWFRFTWK